MKSSKTEREISLIDVPCEIEYTYYKGCKGARDGRFGPPLEPDEPPEVEIFSVKHAGIEMIEYVSENQLEEISNDLLDEIQSDDRD